MISWMDNQAAINQFLNEATSTKAKHIDVRLKHVRQYTDKGIIALTYVHTSKMLADLHIKAFSTPRFLQLRQLWQLRNWTLQVEDDTSASATTKKGALKGPKIRL
uniref:AlNc14C466G11804 protein n=1 Tax=Albugo laibachii Nc14 TaxID=890382 RepID=F0X066_9STRA|nr:AlNc14C466G11804 [Albugo laibachii Nc14]|eukprot:CCA27148.1 AlNc14C466G11804 [Albugo laibachii Nc14]